MKILFRITFIGLCALAFSCLPGSKATPASQWNWEKSISSRSPESSDGVWTGIFTEKEPAKPETLGGLEKSLNRRFASIMWFIDFTKAFPLNDAAGSWNSGYLPNITWEPWVAGQADSIHLADILGGKYDNYITTWARDAASFGKPFFLRWGHEFNGDWYPWSVAKNGQDPAQYIAAYRYVHDLVVKNGALNAIWVWGPNNQSLPPKPWNDPVKAYPGDEYVDWIALDGYDFDGDKSFSDLFERIYSEVVRKFAKPIYLGEFSTGRKGAAKAAWIKDMHEQLQNKFPAIRGLVWFNINKERDWRIEESPESIDAAREVFSSSLYRSNAATVWEMTKTYAQNIDKYRSQLISSLAVEKHKAVAVKLAQPGVVDWKKSTPVAIKGPGDSKASVQILWDEKALYLGADITTKTPLSNPQKGENIWNGSGLELTISTDPSSDPGRGYFADTDWQFGFSSGDAATKLPPQTWEWTKLKSQVAGAQVKATPRSGGYRLEATLPWAVFQGFQPKAGVSVGFDVAIDDSNGSGKRSSQWVWNGNTDFYNNPVQWGLLAFQE